MKRHTVWCFFLFIFLFGVSCSNDETLKKLEQIKTLGDSDPTEALMKLDSLDAQIKGSSDYTKRKSELLRVRLKDKAYIEPTSDTKIKKLVSYFEKNGSLVEKQEVHYYAGSTYRDLQDTPRALEHFYKSIEYANDNGGECDSILLANTYSNIHYLQYRVQNYNESIKSAQKELEISNKIGTDVIIPYMHIGVSYLALNKPEEAEAALDSAYVYVKDSSNESEKQDILVLLLNNYSELRLLSKAKDCFKLITENPLEGRPSYSCVAFAQYYETLGKTDSAAIYCKRLLDEGDDVYYKYDAGRLIFKMYSQVGDAENARRYAEAFMQLSDSMDFGRRQEQAATVNNIYQYHWDQKKEQELKEEKEQYKNFSIIIFLGASLLICIAYILNFKRKQKHQKEVAALSSALQRVSDDGKQLREEIKQKEKELEDSKVSLEKSSDELDNVKKKLLLVNQELAENYDALKKTEQQLEEKKEQNKAYIKLLHQSEFEENAEDVIRTVREASKGKKEMTLAEWKQLYQAVDELYPTFHETILKECEGVGDKEMQVLYLLRIGLSKQQIMNMTNLARVTIWRWEKKFDWVISDEQISS